ncbi:MAG TPA: hypothetical protein VFO39_12050 [Candidatus Sulfotelmatobacter sp.]|nr:hypothetical protein [Candidatus Sulfotelmatobacter sp.]
MKNEKDKVMTRMVRVGLSFTLSLGLLSLTAAAQNQAPTNAQSQTSSGSSLGDYARQVRKDGGQPKAKARVFENENLPHDDKLSIVGQPTPEPAPEKAASQGADKEKAAQTSKDKDKAPEAQNSDKTKTDVAEKKAAEGANAEQKGATKTPEEEAKEKQAAWKQWQDKINAQRDQVELMQRDVEVTQREYQVRAAAFYADAGNRLRNSAAWDQQDQQYKQQIADKQKALDDAKQKLNDMLDQAHKAGVPDSMTGQ